MLSDTSYIIYFVAPLPSCFLFTSLTVSTIPHSDNSFFPCPNDVYVAIRFWSISDSPLVLVTYW